jgi:succinate dehydrogenase / fumarate reductase cytochrome b subunit
MWLTNSSVGRKVVMSVTGLALVLFLTFHMAMNLVAVISAEGYNMICEFLGANWYALEQLASPSCSLCTSSTLSG